MKFIKGVKKSFRKIVRLKNYNLNINKLLILKNHWKFKFLKYTKYKIA